MSNCILHNFNTTLTIVCDNVSSYIRFTVLTVNNNTIKCTLFNSISPDKWHWSRFVIITNYLNSIFMRLLDLVIKNLWFVIFNFDTNSTNLNFILDDISIYIKGCNNCRWPTKSNLVALNLWSWGISLDEYACCLATHDYVLWNNATIFRFTVNHNGSRIEVSKRAFMDHCITFDR